MSGKYSRNKGARAEREVVNMFKAMGFVDTKRISMMETGGQDKGDVITPIGVAEVKIGSQVPKFIYDATKEDTHILICRRDHQKWKLIIDLDKFLGEVL